MWVAIPLWHCYFAKKSKETGWNKRMRFWNKSISLWYCYFFGKKPNNSAWTKRMKKETKQFRFGISVFKEPNNPIWNKRMRKEAKQFYLCLLFSGKKLNALVLIFLALVLPFLEKSRTTYIETNEWEKKESNSALVLVYLGKRRKTQIERKESDKK